MCEAEKESRKPPVHAHESGEKKIGRSFQGLPLEWLLALLDQDEFASPPSTEELSH